MLGKLKCIFMKGVHCTHYMNHGFLSRNETFHSIIHFYPFKAIALSVGVTSFVSKMTNFTALPTTG